MNKQEILLICNSNVGNLFSGKFAEEDKILNTYERATNQNDCNMLQNMEKRQEKHVNITKYNLSVYSLQRMLQGSCKF